MRDKQVKSVLACIDQIRTPGGISGTIRRGVIDLLDENAQMLEALQNIENDGKQVPEHAWNLIQAAITKATGGDAE